jgi:hypothetical protein
MDVGPIFRSEMIRMARRRRHYAMRAVLGLLLLSVAWALYGAFADRAMAMRNGRERARILRQLPWIADLLVLELVWTQGVAIVLLVPGLVAGSIAEEDQRGTMIALLESPLSSGSIVVGKLASRLSQVGVALAIGLPVVVPLAMMGALDLALVARAYALLLAMALFVGSIAMLVAAAVRRPRPAMLWAYLVVGGWLLMPAWSAPLAGRNAWPFSWLRAIADGVLLSHPLEAATNLWRVSMFGLFHPAGVAWARAGVPARHRVSTGRLVGIAPPGRDAAATPASGSMGTPGQRAGRARAARRRE